MTRLKALRGDLLTTVAILAVVANMLWFMLRFYPVSGPLSLLVDKSLVSLNLFVAVGVNG
jgi:hypothetical protein